MAADYGLGSLAMWPRRPDLASDPDSHDNSGSAFSLPAMSMSPTSFASLSSLLTPSESHAFHSFLSSVGPPADHALAKATKDLMALDAQFANHSDAQFPAHSDALFPQVFLPHPPHSDSSSRTPTPTSASPFSGRQSSRTRPSHPHPYPIAPLPKQRRPSTASSSSAQAQPPPQKPALLTPSQKKANHIQSEQKRRANIRRGYEALCDCVPALREAIREEEAALAAANNSSRNPSGPSNGASSSSSSARRKGKSAIKGKGKDGEEKIDGRAGPRSENVVLSKTIDYINELMDERSALLARLHTARSTLPPGHPALIPAHTYTDQGEESGPLWEREWKGGHGTLGNIVDGDESS